jgi:hypothetical protein
MCKRFGLVAALRDHVADAPPTESRRKSRPHLLHFSLGRDVLARSSRFGPAHIVSWCHQLRHPSKPDTGFGPILLNKNATMD